MQKVTESELISAAIAPRVTEALIESKIVDTRFHVDGLLTLCIIELANGFTVVGQSACASPENYNQDIGERLARSDAFSKIWALEGYLLRERLHYAKFARMDAEAQVFSPSRFLSPIHVAAICHDANRQLCLATGDTSQLPWEEAPDWQKDTVLKGVEFHLANPDATPAASHESWLAEKEREGWRYGPVKDAEEKTHPAYVPFDQLPPEQQSKDHQFKGIVDALRPFIKTGPRFAHEGPAPE